MSAKLVVADAGPLIALAVADLLPKCLTMLGGLAVPEAVLQECVADPYAPGATIIAHLHISEAFEIIPHTTFMSLDAALAQGLGTGEIAVLTYANQHQLLALIDERRARRVAQQLRVAVIGSGTLVAMLKREGYIDSVEPVFAAWQKHGYFVAEKVRDEIRLRSRK